MITSSFFKKTLWTFLVIPVCLLLVSEVWPIAHAMAGEKNYHRLIVLGDPHLPGGNFTAKENVIKEINLWNDVDMVVVMGNTVLPSNSSASCKNRSGLLLGITIICMKIIKVPKGQKLKDLPDPEKRSSGASKKTSHCQAFITAGRSEITCWSFYLPIVCIQKI
jgi:hypothetical protein